MHNGRVYLSCYVPSGRAYDAAVTAAHVALDGPADALFSRAAQEVLAVEPAAKEQAVPILLRQLEADTPERWRAAASTYMQIGPADRLHRLMDVLLPRLESPNGRARATAVDILLDYGLWSKDAGYRRRLARGLFTAWRLSGYDDPHGFLRDTLCRLGPDAKGLVAELKELVSAPRVGPAAYALLRSIAPEEVRTLGPRLDGDTGPAVPGFDLDGN